MRKIYLVTGLGCTGKSTMAKRMGERLGIPVFHADQVYLLAMNKLGISRDEVATLGTEEAWKKTEGWGIYKDPQTLIQTCYNELFSYNPPQQFVLEGMGMFANRLENKLIEEYFKDYEKRYLLIEYPYEGWLRFRSKRAGTEGEGKVKFLEEADYAKQQQIMRSCVPEGTMVITDPSADFSNPSGGLDYQSEAFSDPKWTAFGFPEDMKGKTFLDTSCNAGWFCMKASQQGAKTTGLDINWQILDIAMDRNPEGKFYLTKIEDFEPTQTYDYVLCSSAFHYYKKREEQIAKFAKMTNNLTIEMPLLDTDAEEIRYQGGDDFNFQSIVSKGLLLKWLNKYFTKVELIGETSDLQGNKRPVYKCTK